MSRGLVASEEQVKAGRRRESGDHSVQIDSHTDTIVFAR